MSDEKPPPPEYESGQSALARAQVMTQFTPQAQALGIAITGFEPGRIWGKVPYREELVGDPETGVIAGGVITTLLDQVCGSAAVSAMKSPVPVATIDLRIDYMRPATPGQDIHAEALCYKLGKSVAFVRAVAYDDTPDNPVAHAVAAFMVNSNAGRKMGANLKKPKS